MGVKTLSKRELNQRTASVLALVDAGETVIVTERGVPKWQITPYVPDTDPLARLRAMGMIAREPDRSRPWRPIRQITPKVRRTPEEIDALIQEMKGDH